MKEFYENMKLISEKIHYENIIGTFVGILGSMLSCLVTQSFVAFCVSRILGTENVITAKMIGLKENRLFQTEKCSKYSNNPEKVYLLPLHFTLGLYNISSRQWIIYVYED
jgi:hypothetical protein